MKETNGSGTEKYDISQLTVSPVQVLTDATEIANSPLKVRFKGTKANIINENNRLYPLVVLKDGVERANEQYIKPGKAIGESPHPKAVKSLTGKIMFDTKLENSVLKIYNLFMDGTEVFFDAEILETAKGKDLKACISQNVPVGVSMRSIGRNIQKVMNDKTITVATYLDIQAFDVEMNPATDGCYAIEVLTDSQIAELMREEPLEDGIQIQNPVCPSCNTPLNAVDPDNDGDIDFYECSKGCGIFFADTFLSSSVNAGVELRKMSTTDYDRYSQAQNYLATKNKNVVTDSVAKGGHILKIEELVQAVKENPEVRAAVAGIALETAQPALDAVEAQKLEDQKAQLKTEAKVFLDGKIAALKSKMDEKAIKVMTDAIGTPDTKEQAEAIFDSVLKVMSDSTAGNILASLGFTGKTNGEGGQTRIEVIGEAKPWAPIVDTLIKAFDDFGAFAGKTIDPSLRKYNKDFINKIIGRVEDIIGPKVMADSVQGFEMLDGVSVSTLQLLNQPTILTAVLIQAFQDVESLQFMMADAFGGTEWRIPIETFTGANQTPDPITGLVDMLVAEGNGIPESAINLIWQTYQPVWRRNAVSLSTDVVTALATGPAKYEAIARAIYHIGEDKRRKLDNAAYYEMILASDEYAPLVCANESVAADHLIAVSNGTNVAFKALLNGKSALESTKGANPMVRPRTKNVLQTNGTVTQVTTNAFSISASGATLVMGYLDTQGNVQGSGGANYAVDWENGVIYFKTGSGVDATHLPTVSYSAVTNIDRWSFTVPGGQDPATYYNSLIQKISSVAAMMGSSPRFKKPNIGIFSLNSAVFVESAQIFYKLSSPEGTRLIPTGNYFGERSGINFAKINAPWVVGDGRILLTQKGSTKYGVQTPYQIEGPFPKYDSNGNIIAAKVWFGEENSVLCTPQVSDASGNTIQPVSRTIKFGA